MLEIVIKRSNLSILLTYSECGNFAFMIMVKQDHVLNGIIRIVSDYEVDLEDQPLQGGKENVSLRL
jgi:hypothetical protein